MFTGIKYILFTLTSVLIICEAESPKDLSKMSDADLTRSCIGRSHEHFFDGCNDCFCLGEDSAVCGTAACSDAYWKELEKRGLKPPKNLPLPK